jgi:acetyltransferase-like isoleucine patch superfamily enzyme
MKSRGLTRYWAKFWMRVSAIGPLHGLATRLAALSVPPFYGRVALARLSPAGYRSPRAVIHHPAVNTGRHCFIGDDVLIYRDRNGGAVTLGDAVHIHQGAVIQTGEGGAVDIGAETHIQPRCQFSAYKGSIRIGARVEIAPNCAFYPYNHEIKAGIPVRSQPLRSKGDIVVGDDAWLGYGVIVLDGARIGNGAVIGAGSVVTGDIPARAIAVGAPAKVTKMRD